MLKINLLLKNYQYIYNSFRRKFLRIRQLHSPVAGEEVINNKLHFPSSESEWSAKKFYCREGDERERVIYNLLRDELLEKLCNHAGLLFPSGPSERKSLRKELVDLIKVMDCVNKYEGQKTSDMLKNGDKQILLGYMSTLSIEQLPEFSSDSEEVTTEMLEQCSKSFEAPFYKVQK
jgi:hypothetical protein